MRLPFVFLVVALNPSTGRQDVDGLLLTEILDRSDGGAGPKGGGREKSVIRIASRLMYPPDFAMALIDVLQPGLTEKLADLDTRLQALAEASVQGALTGCGMCFAVLGFLLSIGSDAVTEQHIHVLVSVIPTEIQLEHDSVQSLLYATAMEYSSTMGTLASLHRSLELGNDTSICAEFGTLLALLAEESAGTDVFSEFLAPSTIDFDSAEEPLSFLSSETIDSESAGLSYYIRLMKSNAEALSSALMFGAVDLMDMFGMADDVDPDELQRSMDEMSTLDESTIAAELIHALNSARYNMNAIEYNRALELVSSTRDCNDGVVVFGHIVESQSLFVKSIFYLMKDAHFHHHRTDIAFLAALMLSESGVRSGDINAIRLRGMVEDSPPSDTRRYAMVLLSANGMRCGGNPIRNSPSRLLELCLNDCTDSGSCQFAEYTWETQTCLHFTTCRPSAAPHETTQIFEKTELVPTLKCWPPYAVADMCIYQLRRRAALTHNDTESMNWLVYHEESGGNLSAAIEWANRSACAGSSEGRYHLSRLTGKSWVDHRGNFTEATRLFWDLFDSTTGRGSDLDGWDSLDPMEQLEYETIQDLAHELGVTDIQLDVGQVEPESMWPQRLAALAGIAALYADKYWYLIPRIIAIVALIPVLVILISRRTGLVV